MPEEQLEKVMTAFQRGESDVLVCTTIIESGLDIPRANTLIVNRADRFGLTQLYQLRGRVGRGSNLAYAYFLYDKGRRLSPTAEKRLRTIYEATELGAGFGIAMKDLEIRGAGSLLGNSQSGNISAIGFSLYVDLLSQAVEEQKEKRAGPRKEPRPVRLAETTVDLPLRAYLPEEYIPDLDTRLGLYQKLAALNSVGGVDDLAKELADRFGPLPVEVRNMIYVVRVKALATSARVESISSGDGQINVRLFPGLQFEKPKINPMLKYGIKIGLNQVILNTARSKDWPKVLEELLNRAA
jgi:transcription-repair coupling factor (superfamily II helicase)